MRRSTRRRATRRTSRVAPTRRPEPLTRLARPPRATCPRRPFHVRDRLSSAAAGASGRRSGTARRSPTGLRGRPGPTARSAGRAAAGRRRGRLERLDRGLARSSLPQNGQTSSVRSDHCRTGCMAARATSHRTDSGARPDRPWLPQLEQPGPAAISSSASMSSAARRRVRCSPAECCGRDEGVDGAATSGQQQRRRDDDPAAATRMPPGCCPVRRAASVYAHHAAASHSATSAAPRAPPIAVTVGVREELVEDVVHRLRQCAERPSPRCHGRLAATCRFLTPAGPPDRAT